MNNALKRIIVFMLMVIFVFAFAGCNYDHGDGNAGNTTPAGGQESYFNVYFDADSDTEVPTQRVKSGERAIRPDNPTKSATETELYEFIGWFIDGSEYDFDTFITSNITLTARYNTVDRYYTVTFDTDGGTNISTQRVKWGEKATKPDNPQKNATATEQYEFIGWFINENEYDFEETITTDIIIKAKWHVDMFSGKLPVRLKSILK